MKIPESDHQPGAFLRRAAWLVAAGTAIAATAHGARAQQGEQGTVGVELVTPAAPVVPVPGFVELPAAGAPISPASLHCSLDTIDGSLAPLALVLDHRVAATFVGWIADDDKGVPRNIALLLIGEKTYAIAGATGIARADVVAATQKQAFAFSGYSLMGKPAAVPQGEYHLALIGEFGTARLLCPLDNTIAIK